MRLQAGPLSLVEADLLERIVVVERDQEFVAPGLVGSAM
jgi:hypothetical protein